MMETTIKSPFQASRDEARMNRESRRMQMATPAPSVQSRAQKENPAMSNEALANLGEGLQETKMGQSIRNVFPGKGMIDNNIVGI